MFSKKKIETYDVEVCCSNCGKKNKYDFFGNRMKESAWIPLTIKLNKGTEATQRVISLVECPNCGCKGFLKKYEKICLTF